jgi:hypothetical protein
MWAEKDLNASGKLSDDSAKLLALFNISRIVNDTGRGMGFPPSYAEAQVEPHLGRVIHVPHPTPAIFAPQLVKLSPPSGVERPMLWREDFAVPLDPQASATLGFLGEFLKAMNPQLKLSSASRIPVLELPAEYPAEKIDKPSVEREGTTQIQDYQVTTDEVRLKLEAPENGYLQISHPWYPTLAVYQDNMRVKSYRSSINLIVLPIQAGVHSFRIVPERSHLRQSTGSFSAIVLLLTLLVPILSGLSNRRTKSGETLGF